LASGVAAFVGETDDSSEKVRVLRIAVESLGHVRDAAVPVKLAVSPPSLFRSGAIPAIVALPQ
jgi:hypothetical protein